MKKLSEAINELTRLISKNKRLRRSELKRVLEQTLEGLDDILSNSSLHDSIESAVTKRIGDEEMQIVTDLRKFQDTFLSSERRALGLSGIDTNSGDVLIQKIRPFRKEIETLVDRRKSLRSMLEEAREIVNDLLIKLEEPDIDSNNKQLVGKQLRRVLALAGGTAIVVVNTTLVPTLVPTSPAIVSVSIAFGGGLIGKYL